MGQNRSVDIKSIGHRFPLDINCGSPPNRRTTDTVQTEQVMLIKSLLYDIRHLYLRSSSVAWRFNTSAKQEY